MKEDIEWGPMKAKHLLRFLEYLKYVLLLIIITTRNNYDRPLNSE